jgi:hypothetical protein
MKLTLLIAAGALVCGLFTGIIAISIGVGSMFTGVNTVMAPLVCPGDDIVPVWTYHPKGKPALANGPDLATRWICVNGETGEAHVAGYRTIFTAGTVYGLLCAVGFFLLGRNRFVRPSAPAGATPKSRSSRRRK